MIFIWFLYSGDSEDIATIADAGDAEMSDQRRAFIRKRLYSKLLTSLGVISIPTLIIAYGFTAGRLLESLLVVVMWIQLEISLRQMEIYKRSLEPSFTVDLCSTELSTSKYLKVHNAGNSVAYGVGICRILTKEYIPLDPHVWSKHVKPRYVDIPPGDSKEIAEIYDTSVLDEHVIEVCYETVEGAFRFFHILELNGSPHVIRIPEDLPGPLLNSVNFLYDALRFGLWLKRRLKYKPM